MTEEVVPVRYYSSMLSYTNEDGDFRHFYALRAKAMYSVAIKTTLWCIVYVGLAIRITRSVSNGLG